MYISHITSKGPYICASHPYPAPSLAGSISRLWDVFLSFAEHTITRSGLFRVEQSVRYLPAGLSQRTHLSDLIVDPQSALENRDDVFIVVFRARSLLINWVEAITTQVSGY